MRNRQTLKDILDFWLSRGAAGFRVDMAFYGDEIGMRFQPGLPNVEGSICNPGYNRAGCRTPMQWDDSTNAGFSTAPAADLYLPIDPDANRPNVADQRDDPDSTLHLVQRLVALRRATPALRTAASQEVIKAGYPFVYVRGGTHLVAVNPPREPRTVSYDAVRGAKVLIAEGLDHVAESVVDADEIRLDGFGYAIFELV